MEKGVVKVLGSTASGSAGLGAKAYVSKVLGSKVFVSEAVCIEEDKILLENSG